MRTIMRYQGNLVAQIKILRCLSSKRQEYQMHLRLILDHIEWDLKTTLLAQLQMILEWKMMLHKTLNLSPSSRTYLQGFPSL